MEADAAMLRRVVVIPAPGWIAEHTTQGTRLDGFVGHRLRRTINRLSDRDVDRFNRIRRPRHHRP